MSNTEVITIPEDTQQAALTDAEKYADPSGPQSMRGCSQERVEEQLRIALDGHPKSELWGENGLIAATMRAARMAMDDADKPNTQPEPAAAHGAAGHRQTMDGWFLSLPPGRQAVLIEDKWRLAQAAFIAGAQAEFPGVSLGRATIDLATGEIVEPNVADQATARE